ncbi:MAG TPA: ribose-phosphate diphosphokinase [Candidatus Eisenbacteria bacterium]|nr:ribose-phosphate diphosphokinase [Candidatus Eisenbacteria bacterium]
MADRIRPPRHSKADSFSVPFLQKNKEPRLIKSLKTRFIYGTPHFAILANDPAMTAAREVGEILHKSIPDNLGTFGNAEHKVIVPQDKVQTRDVYVFQTTDDNPDSNLRQAKLLAIGAKGAGANRIYNFCLNLAYGRQDRVIIPGEPDSARNVSQEILDAGSHNYRKKRHESALKADASLLVVDVHSETPLRVINRDSHYEWINLSSDSVVIPAIQQLIETHGLDPVMAFPDETAKKRYGYYAEIFSKGIESSVTVKKLRPPEKKNEVELAPEQEDFAEKVAGMDVIIRDDIFDTGRTAIQACKAFIEAGARSVRVVATHGVLSGNAAENIQSPYLTELIITDTIPLRNEFVGNPKITVVKIAPLLAETMRRIEAREPLGELAKGMSPGFEKSYMKWRKINKYRRRGRKNHEEAA